MLTLIRPRKPRPVSSPVAPRVAFTPAPMLPASALPPLPPADVPWGDSWLTPTERKAVR